MCECPKYKKQTLYREYTHDIIHLHESCNMYLYICICNNNIIIYSLQTVCNLGGNWPTSIILWLVDVLTWKKCTNLNITNTTNMAFNLNNTCVNKAEVEVEMLLIKIKF